MNKLMSIFKKEYKGIKFTVHTSGYRQVITIQNCKPIVLTDTKIGAIVWAKKEIDKMQK